MKRIITCSIAGAAVLALAGCNSSDTAGAPSSTSTPSSSSTPVSTQPSQQPSRSTVTSIVTVPASSPGQDGSSPVPTFSHVSGPTTYFRDVWPDSSWTIKDISQDKCTASTAGGSAPHASVFAFKTDQFGCGVGADALQICGRSGNVVMCMTDYRHKVAVRFTTAAPTTTFPLPSPHMPLMVKLENGATCTYADHDTAQHYKGLTSQLPCHDWWGQGGSALLPVADGGYFYLNSPTWSVDYGVGTNPPTQDMAVDEIVFAQQQ